MGKEDLILLSIKVLMEFLALKGKGDIEKLETMIATINTELAKEKKIASGDLSGIV